MSGLVTKTLDWLAHPSHSDGTVGEYLAGLLLILIIAFLWSTTLKQIE